MITTWRVFYWVGLLGLTACNLLSLFWRCR